MLATMRREAARTPETQRDLPDCFFLFRNGEEDGPFSLQELKHLQESGAVSPATPCRSRTGKEWHDLAFLLRKNSRDESADGMAGSELGASGEGLALQPSLRERIDELVDISHHQVRVLNSLKWGLWILIVMTAGVILASRT